MKKYFSIISNKFKSLRRKTKIKLLVLGVLLIWFYCALPKILFNAPTSYILEDKNGELLNATIAADGQWRFPFNEKVPQKFIDCITAFEDKRFFYHPGVDPVAFVRAVKKNISGKGSTQGGSTVTMQVIRLSEKNSNRNIWWFDIPVSRLAIGQYEWIHLLLHTPSTDELLHLKVPTVFLREKLEGLVVRNAGKRKSTVSLELSADKDSFLKDVRPAGTGVDFTAFLL